MARSIVLISALTLTVIFGYVQVSGALQCYTCSYVFSGNTGILDYECVNDTSNAIKASVIPCAAPRKCVIKTVYEREYSRLRSLDKGCHAPEKKAGCDEYDEVRPTCYDDCDTDLCNGKDGDLKPKPAGKTSALKSAPSLILGLILLLFMNSIDM